MDLESARVPEPRTLVVAEDERGWRLDLFLAEKLRLSRAQSRRLLVRGAVRVEGRVVGLDAKGRALAAGVAVEVAPFLRPDEQRARPAPGRRLPILAQGDGWLALDKPAGMPVHPLEEQETETLLSAAIARHPQMHGVGEGGLRSGVVHRLDVDTSGALLMATEQATWERLREAFRARNVEKLYRTVVLGRLSGEGREEVALVTARHRPARVRVVTGSERERTRGARPASLAWRSLEVFDGATLLEVRLETGFLHQIRVTLAHRGFPVAGDRTYGAPGDPTGAPRQMLHAARVRTGDIDATSPDPPDFAALLEQLRGPTPVIGSAP